MAIGLVILAQVCFQLSYDDCIPDLDQVYCIHTDYTQQGTQHDYNQVSGAVAPGFKAEVPGVLEATRYTGVFESDNYLTADKSVITAEKTLLMADSSFFRIFPREFLAGSPQEALNSWSGAVAVSRSLAEKLGGVAEAIGKELIPEEMPALTLNIVGVYEDFPENCSIQADILCSIEGMAKTSTENWVGNDRYLGYVKLAKGVDAASLAPAIRKMQEVHQPLEEAERNGMTLKYYLRPMKGYYLSSPAVRNQVIVLSVIAFLLLMISLMNYILMAVTEVIRRSREVGVRKCYGAGSKEIYKLLLKESAVNLALSLAVAVVVIMAFKGTIESLIRSSITDMFIPQTWWTVGVTVALIFIISTIVPGRLFERIPISAAFRGYKETRRKWKISLLTLQFCINVFMLIMVLTTSLQYRKVLNEDVGYDTENLAYIRLNGSSRDAAVSILDRLRNLSCVESAAMSYTLPYEPSSGNNVRMPGEARDLFNIADQYESSEGFHALMGFRLLEGRYPEKFNEILVSKSFTERMAQFADWSDGAVGKVVRISEHSDFVENEADGDLIIAGVVEDVRIGSAVENDDRPAVWFHSDMEHDFMKTLVVRLTEMNQANRDSVSAVIKELGDETDCNVKVYSETLRDMYVFQKNMKNTFLIGAIAALLIALFGLYGFLSDETARRSAEVAVRRVNGALSSEIVKLFVTDITKLALIALVIGDVGGWLAASKWLEQFPQRINLSVWIFAAADVIFLVIVILTVVLRSLKISHTNPALTLKRD